MFESSHDYEGFYVNEEHGLDDEVRDGASWLRDYPGSDEGLIVSPTKQNLGYSSVTSVFGDIRPGKQVRLGRRLVRALTWRTFPPSNPWWEGGPVLALWPSDKFLGTLHDHYGLKALCVIVGSMDDVRTWVAASGAFNLRTGSTAPGPPPLDPVVEQAMISLTRGLNHNNNLLGSYDKAEAINALQALRRGRYRLDPERLETWALAHDWPAEEASRFREFVVGVNAGRRYRIPNMYRSDILDHWKKQAAETT